MQINRRKLRYALLKEIDRGNNSEITPENIGISLEELYSFLDQLQEDGFIRGAGFYMKLQYDLSEARLTEKGEQDVDENNPWTKTYKTIKEIREFILP